MNNATFALFILSFQMHALAENSLKFQQIEQNSFNLPTDSANDAKFAPFIYLLYIMFQMPDHWQRTLRNFSESGRFCSIHPQLPRIMQNLHHLFTHYILCLRCLTIGRELSKIPANQAEFTQFSHRTRELRELCAFRTKIHPHLVHYFQTSDHRQRTLENWSESTRFHTVRPQLPRIMRNSLNLHP